MEMDSYKSRILDGVLMGSGTKMKSHEPVLQIACVSVSIFCTNCTLSRVPGFMGEALFWNFKFFLLCLPIVD
jgi:hypothetical protein